MSLPTAQGATDLDARYGRRPARRRGRGVVIAAIALVAAAAVWLVWAQPWTTQTFWKSTGYQIIDDRTLAVNWSVTLGDGERATCALAALNPARAIVGWKVVEVEGTGVPTQMLSEPIRTTEAADTGLAYRCWLP